MSRKKKRAYRKKPWIFLAPLLVFVAGAGIFLYPAVSNLIAEQQQRTIIRDYRISVDEAEEAEVESAWEKARMYNEDLAGDPVHDPFILGSGYVLPDNYDEVLNLSGNGVMGYIEIPRIEVDLPVYHGTSEEVLTKGVGHVEVTSLPIGGEERYSLLCAHRGLPSAELFTRLNELELGDVFYIHILDEIHAYEVDQIKVIEPEELEGLVPVTGRDLITLMTCTPYGVNTHRLLVRGSRIPYEREGDPAQRATMDTKGWRKVYIGAAVAGMIAAVGAGIVITGSRKKKRSVKRRRHYLTRRKDVLR